MKKMSLIVVLTFLVAGVAWSGPACASIAKGQPACCQNCPSKMLPKVGNSCCKGGIEKGTIGLAFKETVKRPLPLITTHPLEKDPIANHYVTVSNFLPRQQSHIYLTERHLLI